MPDRPKVSFDGLNLEDIRDVIDELIHKYGAASQLSIDGQVEIVVVP